MITSYLSNISLGMAPSPFKMTSNIGSGLPSTNIKIVSLYSHESDGLKVIINYCLLNEEITPDLLNWNAFEFSSGSFYSMWNLISLSVLLLNINSLEPNCALLLCETTIRLKSIIFDDIFTTGIIPNAVTSFLKRFKVPV